MTTAAMLPVALDLSLKSSFVVILAWLGLRAWRNASAAQRGYLWCAAFAVLIMLPFTRLVAPHWEFSFSKTTSGKVAQVEPAIMISRPEIREGAGAIPPGASVAGRKQIDGTFLVLGVWIGGIFSALAYRAMGTWQLRRYLRASVPLRNEACEELAISISADFGLARSVEVRVCPDCLVPMTWGTWRPVILLPTEALTWSRAWMEAALRHEMGHVKNRDHLKRLGAFLTCAFYWPNPFVWMAARQLQLAQEEASDNLVLAVEIPPQEYAAQLIEVIRSLASGQPFSIPAVSMARCSTLEGRLAAIMDEKRNRRDVGIRLAALGIGFAVVLAIASGTVQVRADNSGSTNATHVTNPHPDLTAPAKATLSDSSNVTFITTPADDAGRATERKLQAIVIDHVDFTKTDVAEVLKFFTRKSREIDPDKKGLKFVLGDLSHPTPQNHFHRLVTFQLDDVPLEDLLGYVVQQTNLKCSVGKNTVYLNP